MCCGDEPCHAHVKRALSRVMYRYGQMVASHPWPFVVLPLLVFGGLGAGLMKVETASKTDDIFLSRHSQGFKDRATVKDLFPDRTRDFYDALELNEEQIMGSIIFMARDNQSVYDPDVVSEIRDIITKVKVNVTVKVGDQVLIYEDLCGRHDNSCVVTGERLLAPQFNAMREMGILTYPKWRLPTTNASVDLSFALADSDKHLKRVGVVRVTFKLRHDLKKESFAWEDAFVKFVQGLETNNTDIAFSSSQSFRQELYADFTGDLLFFWVCLGLVAFCACVVCTGCDVVSTRTLLTLSGVLSSGAGTVGAFGVLSFCGIKIVEMTWVTPLLVLSMGLGHTFLLMSSWSDTLSDTELHVPQRVGVILTMAGVGITVTSLSVSTAFAIGYTSSFMVVSNFSLYAGVALAFCYITTMTFTVGCLALHGHRVYSSRHCCTCCATKPRDQLRKEGRLLCTSLVCGGSIPKEKGGDHSLLERLTQKILKTAVNSVAGKVVVVLLFLGYLGVSIYGVTNLEQRVDLKKLVSRSSYFHKYISWDSEYFGFSFPVAFYIKTGVMYNESTANKMERLINRAKKDGDVDEEFERCWLTDFVKSDFYNASESGAEFNGPAGEFNGSAVESFLVETKTYLGDVVMDETGEVIVASRCFVFSQKVSDQSELAGLTGRMRAVAKGSGLPVFAFHPAFLNYEQLLDVLPTTLQTIGITVGVMCGISIFFLPQLIVVSLATLNAVSVLVGIFGFTYFWDISLTVFTMNHLIISAGFAVLSSVPVCSAYFMSESTTREERASDAVARAACAVFNIGTCAAVGLLPLLTTRCFFFDVFFKMMICATLFGAVNGGLVQPVLLSLIGHEDIKPRSRKQEQSIKKLKPPKSGKAPKSPKVQKNKETNEKLPETTQHLQESIHYYNISPTGSVDQNDHHFANTTNVNKNSGRAAKRNKREKSSPKQENRFNDLSGDGVHHYENGFIGNQYYQPSSVLNKPLENDSYTPQMELYDLPAQFNTKFTHNRHAPPVPTKPFRRNPGIVTPSDASVPAPDKNPRQPQRRPVDSSPERYAYSEREDRRPSPRQPKTIPNVDDQYDSRLFPSHDLQPRDGGDGGYVNLSFVKSVASLENIHHVACTLSNSGKLGSSQAYVTENFKDYPR